VILLEKIAIFILFLGPLVFFHELGHFLFARLFKVKVICFSIGFGKPLCHFYDKQGTEYVIAMIPLGGYVRLLDAREDKIKPSEKKLTFDQKPIYQRFAILSAGPLMNIVFAIFAYWLVFSLGIKYVKPIIGTVVLHSIASQAGLKTGDEIVYTERVGSSNLSPPTSLRALRYGSASQSKCDARRLSRRSSKSEGGPTGSFRTHGHPHTPRTERRPGRLLERSRRTALGRAADGAGHCAEADR
jgi:membrane-associated protease RseP (regulator of RpoE activity)